MRKTLFTLIALLCITRGCPAQVSYEVEYRVKHSTASSYPNVTGVLYKKDRNGLYFRIIPEEPLYIMLNRHRYKHLHLQIGDTITYNTNPDIYYRVKQVYIKRTVRRFKR